MVYVYRKKGRWHNREEEEKALEKEKENLRLRKEVARKMMKEAKVSEQLTHPLS